MPPCRRLRTRSGRRATSCWSSARTPERAYAEFRWPALDEFNWALDWFDAIARRPTPGAARASRRTASEQTLSFAELADALEPGRRTGCASRGVARGDRLILMLGNQVELWETMLAAMKLGAVIIPATTLLGAGRPGRPDRARQRAARGRAARPTRPSSTRCRATTRGSRSAAAVDGWHRVRRRRRARPTTFAPDGATRASDPLLLYFTSGTTAQPKLVEHTHASLSGRAPLDDVLDRAAAGRRAPEHLARRAGPSTPGSSFFAPWNAEATVLVFNYARFDARRAARRDGRAAGVTTFCAPPTVWRMLIQADLGAAGRSPLREVVARRASRSTPR